jgi:hypothetical protein
MPRHYDDTPVVNDPGMPDAPLPRLSPFGQWVYHTVIHRALELEATPSAAKKTISFESVAHFLTAVRYFAAAAKQARARLRVVDEAVGGHQQWALFYLLTDPDSAETINLRCAGDPVKRLIRSKVLPFEGGAMIFDVAKGLSPGQVSAILRGMPTPGAG